MKKLMWKEYNPNPKGKRVGDCVVRALSKALGMDWDDTYIALCVEGYLSCDLPSANAVWDRYLIKNGFKRYTLPERYADCYAVQDFAEENPCGVFVVGTGTHAIAIIDGVIYDAWDSTHEQPIYYYCKETAK